MNLEDISQYYSDFPIREHAREAIPHIGIATSTFYPAPGGKMSPDTELRARLALKFLESAVAQGYRNVIVVDGGSDDGWVAEAKRTGASLISVDKSTTMGLARRIAVRQVQLPIASWIEPEKVPLIVDATGQSPLARAAFPILEGAADLIIPRRKDLSSYPIQQRCSETAGNLTFMEMMRAYNAANGRDHSTPGYLDYFFGPRVFNEKAGAFFVGYNGTLNGKPADRWDVIYVSAWRALMNGLRVGSVPVDYIHPKEQTAFEEGNPTFAVKRIKQLSEALEGALLVIRAD